MKENKKNDILEYVDKLIQKEKIIDYRESRGTIILKNGFMFQLPQMFNYFRDCWLAYVSAKLEKDNKKREALLKISNNGVVTNGIFSVDLNNVSLMVAEDKEHEFESATSEDIFNESDTFDEDTFDEGDTFDKNMLN